MNFCACYFSISTKITISKFGYLSEKIYFKLNLRISLKKQIEAYTVQVPVLLI
jgi:hypothetical protein